MTKAWWRGRGGRIGLGLALGLFLGVLGALPGGAGAAPAARARVPTLEAAWLSPDGSGDVVYQALDAGGQPIPGARPGWVPLGSLWKLFVFAYLAEEDRPAPDYRCRGPAGGAGVAEAEVYCCEPGGRIDRDGALVASCGAFFSPSRLGIDPEAWRRFWAVRAAAAPWLLELPQMRPETSVPLASLLAALAAIPERARQTASRVLLPRVLARGAGAGVGSEDAQGVLRYFGGRLRVKTFSWYRPVAGVAQTRQGPRLGGAAGWLLDGTVVWFAAPGTGQQVLDRQGAQLARLLPLARGASTVGCVTVDFFERYPLVRVEGPDGRPAPLGPLAGRHVAIFRNGQSLPFLASGEVWLRQGTEGPRVSGRFTLDEYVARVIDREADARETEAARALGVVARTYLVNGAASEGSCLHIADASRTQRVSASPPSERAREAAAFTSELVLRGEAVGFHQDRPGPGRMAWQEAVRLGRSGVSWAGILARTLPGADMAALYDPAGLPCERLEKAELWLKGQSRKWQRALSALPGFEAPGDTQVCRLQQGRPFSEADRGRIHVRDLASLEDRITLAHEYLHLGLRHHPASGDEGLVERWARRLVNGGGVQ